MSQSSVAKRLLPRQRTSVSDGFFARCACSPPWPVPRRRIGFMLYAGRRNPSRLLVLLFAVWVLSPFGAATLAWAPRRYARLTQ